MNGDSDGPIIRKSDIEGKSVYIQLGIGLAGHPLLGRHLTREEAKEWSDLLLDCPHKNLEYLAGIGENPNTCEEVIVCSDCDRVVRHDCE